MICHTLNITGQSVQNNWPPLWNWRELIWCHAAYVSARSRDISHREEKRRRWNGLFGVIQKKKISESEGRNYTTVPKLMITFASNSLKAYSIIDRAVESCTKAEVIIRKAENPTEMHPRMNLRDPEGYCKESPWFYAWQFVFRLLITCSQ